MKNPGRLVMTLVVILLAGYTYYWYQIKPHRAATVGSSAPGAARVGAGGAAASGDLEGYFSKDTFLAVKLDLAAMAEMAARNGWKEAVATPDLADYFRRVVGALDPEAQTLVRVLSGYMKEEIMLGVMPPPRLDVEATLSVPVVFAGRVDKNQATGFLNAVRTAYRQDFPNRPEVVVRETPEIWSVTTRKAKLYCSWQEKTGLFFASMDVDLLAKTLQRAGAGAGSIAQNSEYAQITQKYVGRDGGRPVLVAFCDTKAMVDNWYAYMERAGRVDTLREKQLYDVRRMMDGLALTSVRGLAFLVQSASDGVRTTRFLDVGKNDGVFRLFATSSSDRLASPSLVPADVAAYAGAVVQIGSAWDEIKKAMDKVGGSPDAAFIEATRSFAAAAGVSLDDLIYELGNEVAVACAPGQTLPSLVLLRTKSDRFTRLLSQAAEHLGLSVEQRTATHGPLYVVGGGATRLPFSQWAAFSYQEPFTYLAHSPEALLAVFQAQTSGQVLAEREDFKALAAKIPGDRNMIRFVSADYLAARAESPGEGWATLGLVRGLPINLAPQRPLLESSLCVGQYGGEGVVVRGISQKGGDLGMQAVAALGMAPDLARLRERYQIMLLRERLGMVENAKKQLAGMYNLTAGTPVTADGEGKNTYDLLTAGLLPEQPMCPITHKPLIVNPVGTPPTSPLFEEEGQKGVEAMLRENMQATGQSSPSALRGKLVEFLRIFVAPGS